MNGPPTPLRTGFGKIRPHTIIALVEDKPGVLNRIASKWRQRGFNIESLAVGHSEKPGLSRMTFVVDADTDAEQVVRQLDKLVDVAPDASVCVRLRHECGGADWPLSRKYGCSTHESVEILVAADARVHDSALGVDDHDVTRGGDLVGIRRISAPIP